MLFENLNYLFENFQKNISFIYLNIFKKKLNILFENFQKNVSNFLFEEFQKNLQKKSIDNFFWFPIFLRFLL